MATSSSGDVARMAERVWGMLDQLAEDNPEEYQRFVSQQLKEGGEMFTPPQPVFCLRCDIIGVSTCNWVSQFHDQGIVNTVSPVDAFVTILLSKKVS